MIVSVCIVAYYFFFVITRVDTRGVYGGVGLEKLFSGVVLSECT